jgi:hypothetical protein
LVNHLPYYTFSDFRKKMLKTALSPSFINFSAENNDSLISDRSFGIRSFVELVFVQKSAVANPQANLAWN